MINYQEEYQDIISQIGTSHAGEQGAPNRIMKAFNNACEYIAENVLRDSFIFEYTFTTVSGQTDYNIPLIFALKSLWVGGVEKKEMTDFVFTEDRLTYPDRICISRESIYIPEDEGIVEITVQYRGIPTKVTTETITQAVNLPQTFAKAIVPLTAYFFFMGKRMKEQADVEFGNYLLLINGTKGALLLKSEKEPQRMSGNHRF